MSGISVNGNSGAYPDKDIPEKAAEEQQKENLSIFDRDRDGTISIEEQKEAYADALKNDENIQNAVKKGFNFQKELNTFYSIMSDITITSKEQIKKIDDIVQGMVKSFVDSISRRATKFIALTPPAEYDKENGLAGDAHINYIIEKLDGMGVQNIDFELLSDIMARYDYAVDENNDATISKKEVNKSYSPDYFGQYMNKNEKGKIIDTNVLDWIINQYMDKAAQKTKQTDNPEDSKLSTEEKLEKAVQNLSEADKKVYNNALANSKDYEVICSATIHFEELQDTISDKETLRPILDKLYNMESEFVSASIELENSLSSAEDKEALSQLFSGMYRKESKKEVEGYIDNAQRVVQEHSDNTGVQFINAKIKEAQEWLNKK